MYFLLKVVISEFVYIPLPITILYQMTNFLFYTNYHYKSFKEAALATKGYKQTAMALSKCRLQRHTGGWWETITGLA